MKLPNAEQAVIDIDKLRDYCLSPSHPRGKHKAKVFAVVLGLHSADASVLLSALRRASTSNSFIRGESDEYGQRYMLDFEMTTEAGSATIRSAWIVRASEEIPRFVTCYVL